MTRRAGIDHQPHRAEIDLRIDIEVAVALRLDLRPAGPPPAPAGWQRLRGSAGADSAATGRPR